MTTPSITDPKSSLPVHSAEPNKILDLVIRLHRLAGVPPEALDYVVFDQVVVEVPVVHVRDLELAAARRCQLTEHPPHRFVIEVDTRDRELAWRLVGLFDDVLDLSRTVQLGHAEVT